MIRRKNRFMVRLSDDERKMYDALRERIKCEEWSEFIRECLRSVYEVENRLRPIIVPDVQKETEFPLVDLKKRPKKQQTKKPAKKRVKVASA